MNLLDSYAYYLFQREVAILMTFRCRGRTRRLVVGAYWRTTLLPLAFFLGYGIAFLLSVPEGVAVACGVTLLSGVLFGEFMLFQQNKLAWPVFASVLRWDQISAYHKEKIGPLPSWRSDNSQAKERNEHNNVNEVPQKIRHMILKGYLAARRTPPTFEGWVIHSPEIRVLLVLAFIVIVLYATSNAIVPSGIWLTAPMFALGVQLRRIKMALDFILTWPLMEQYIDWQLVYRYAGTVEEVEF